MPAQRVGLRDEHRARLGEPVTELGVLTERQGRVGPSHGPEQRRGQRYGRAHVDAVEERAGRVAEAAVPGDELVDPVVPVVGVGLEEGGGPVLGDGDLDLGGGGRGPGHGGEAQRAHDHQVVGEVVPAHVRLEVVPVGDDVGVHPVDHLAVRDGRAGLQGPGDAPAAGSAADEPGAFRGDLGKAERGRAAVVHDDHFEKVRGVGLGGEGGQREVEFLLLPPGGDHHAHRHARLPRAEGGRVEHAVVVAGDPRRAHAVSTGSSMSALGRKPRHWRLLRRRNVPIGSRQVWLAALPRRRM